MVNPVIRHHIATAFRYHPGRAWAVIVGSGLAAATLSLVTPLIVAMIIEAIQHGRATLHELWPLLVAFAATHIYTNVIGWRINAYFVWTLESLVERRLFMMIHQRLLQHSLDYHSSHMSGAVVSNASKYARAFIDLWQMISLELVPTMVVVVGSIIISFVIYPPLGVVLFLASTAYVVAVRYGSRGLRRRVKATTDAHSHVTGILADDLSNIAAVKAFSNSALEQDRMQHATRVLKQRSYDWMWHFIKISTIYTSIMSAVAIAVAVLSVYAAEHQLMSLSLIYLAFTYSLNLAQRLWNVNSVFKTFYNVIGNSQATLDMLQQPPSIVDQPTAEVLRAVQGNVKFDAVSFRYEQTANSIINELSLTIPAGQKVGIVGHSGAGKTTLSKLLLRFVEPTSGVICIDGQDVSKITQDSLHEAIAYVPQEPLLFHRSLRDNIAYGRQNASDDEVISAAKKAHAWEFIESLPAGLDTIVGERGVKLSGGQRQRVAIARAIIKQAPILLLDEATSALDSESERLIQSTLTDLMQRKTTIAIAHRLSTLRKMDRIVVLERGRLVEDGTHEELLAQDGVYANLWAHQSGGFIAE